MGETDFWENPLFFEETEAFGACESRFSFSGLAKQSENFSVE
jgi:hypothetical protein